MGMKVEEGEYCPILQNLLQMGTESGFSWSKEYSSRIYYSEQAAQERVMTDQDNSKSEWTTEQVINAVSVLVKKRHGIAFDVYVEMVKREDDSVDRCRDSDILGLLRLIGVGVKDLVA